MLEGLTQPSAQGGPRACSDGLGEPKAAKCEQPNGKEKRSSRLENQVHMPNSCIDGIYSNMKILHLLSRHISCYCINAHKSTENNRRIKAMKQETGTCGTTELESKQ